MIKVLMIIGIIELAFVVIRMLAGVLENAIEGKGGLCFVSTIETAIVIYVLITLLTHYY